MKEVEEAVDRVMAGPERKSRIMDDGERRLIAYHEGGHAMVAHVLPNTDEVHKITVIPRGRALGYTLTLPEQDRFLMTRELVHREGIFCGGSGGAAVRGAIKYARKLDKPGRLLVLLPDSAQKYLSKIFNDEWMRSNGFLEDDETEGTVAHILNVRPPNGCEGRVLAEALQ